MSVKVVKYIPLDLDKPSRRPPDGACLDCRPAKGGQMRRVFPVRARTCGSLFAVVQMVSGLKLRPKNTLLPEIATCVHFQTAMIQEDVSSLYVRTESPTWLPLLPSSIVRRAKAEACFPQHYRPSEYLYQFRIHLLPLPKLRQHGFQLSTIPSILSKVPKGETRLDIFAACTTPKGQGCDHQGVQRGHRRAVQNA